MVRVDPKSALELAVAGALGSGVLTLTEWVLFTKRDLARLTDTSLQLGLPVLMGSRWFLLVFACALLFRLAEYARERTAGRRRLVRLAVALPVVLLFLLYGASLAVYTFSGQEAQQLWFRPLALVLMPLALAAALSLPFVLYAFHTRSRLWWILGLPVCGGGMIAALLLNKYVLPEEYEPLHGLLSVLALAFSSYLGATTARWVRLPPLRWLGHVALGLLVVLALTGMSVLGRNSRLTYAAQGAAVGARYLELNEASSVDLSTAERSAPLSRMSMARSEGEAEKRRAERAGRPAPHIIVVSIDNIQTSRVGAYGYKARPTTPNIDNLAKQSLVFDRAYSSFPRTRVFLSSMLTGRLLPPFTEHEMPARYRETSLTRLMSERGYRILMRGWFDAAFRFKPDGYAVDTWMPPSAESPGQAKPKLPFVSMNKTYATVRNHFKAAVEADKPAFTWMHFLRPHPTGDGFHGEEKVGYGQGVSADYDSALVVADGYLRKLQRLAERELGDGRPIYWIVMSDHGAGFSTVPGVDEWERDRTVAERNVKVPLIIAGPGIEPGRSQTLVSSSIDMAATVLDLAGITPPADYEGMSLVPELHGYADLQKVRSRAIYLRYYSWKAVIRGPYKGTSYRGVTLLTDLSEDPHETTNIADQREELTLELAKLCARESKRIELGYAKK